MTNTSPTQAAKAAIPEDVMRALDRMCTPLHESHLKGATAEADAHSMKIIRDYIFAASEARDMGASDGLAVAWVRRHPDGERAGEMTGDWLWDGVIERCRKDSGVWFPLGALATRTSEAAPKLEVFDSHEVDHGTHVEVVPHYREAAPVAVGDATETASVLRLCIRELRGWMKDHGQDIRSQEAIKRANALLASQAAPNAATTVYSPEFVRNKFADYETQILNLREELAVRRGSQAAPETQPIELSDADLLEIHAGWQDSEDGTLALLRAVRNQAIASRAATDTSRDVRPMTPAEVDAQPDWIKSARTPEAS